MYVSVPDVSGHLGGARGGGARGRHRGVRRVPPGGDVLLGDRPRRRIAGIRLRVDERHALRRPGALLRDGEVDGGARRGRGAAGGESDESNESESGELVHVKEPPVNVFVPLTRNQRISSEQTNITQYVIIVKHSLYTYYAINGST